MNAIRETIGRTLKGSESSAGTGNLIWRHRWLPDVIAVGVLMAAALMFTANVAETMDVRSADESYYMNSGLTLEEHGLTAAQWGPVYQVWYYLLHQVVEDPLDLYYFNYRMLIFLLPLSLYLFLRGLRAPPIAGMVAALYFLLCQVAYIWPFPANFSTILVLTSAGIAANLKAPIRRIACFAGGVVLAGFVRPELILSFGFLMGVAGCVVIWTAVRKRSEFWRTLTPVIAAAAFGGLLFWIFGNPYEKAKGGETERSFMAFGQHYSVNRVETSDESINPWIHWETILRRDFPTANTLAECVKENPAAFRWHFFRNLRNTFIKVGSLALPNRTFFREPHWRGIGMALALAVLFAWAGWSAWRKRKTSGERGSRERLDWFPFLVMVAVSAASAPSVLLIYPRLHYVLLPLAIGIVIIVYFAGWLFGRRRQGANEDVVRETPLLVRRLAPLAIAGVVALILLPRREQGVKEDELWEQDLNMVRSILALRELGVTEANFLRADGGIEFYLGPKVVGLAPWDHMEKGETYNEFAERRDVQVILDEPWLRNLNKIINDPEFKAIHDDPEGQGYVVVEIPKTNPKRRLLIREDFWKSLQKRGKKKPKEKPPEKKPAESKSAPKTEPVPAGAGASEAG